MAQWGEILVAVAASRLYCQVYTQCLPAPDVFCENGPVTLWKTGGWGRMSKYTLPSHSAVNVLSLMSQGKFHQGWKMNGVLRGQWRGWLAL